MNFYCYDAMYSVKSEQPTVKRIINEVAESFGVLTRISEYQLLSGQSVEIKWGFMFFFVPYQHTNDRSGRYTLID